MSEIKIPISGSSGSTWTLHNFDTVDSTNRVAADLAKEGRAEGQVILADHQDSGRGRLDREWIASPGTSVLMSILLRPKFPTEFFFLITSALALAASQTVRSKFSIPCQLKWPNDVMVDDRKIAGILAEANFNGIDGASVVVGIGLNCKQTADDLRSLGRPATSIFAECGVSLDLLERREFASEIAERFGTLYLSLDDLSSRISVASLYRQACDTVGKVVRVEMTDETLVGVASDISVEGNLLVETDACMRAIPAGDVVHLRKAD